MESSTKEGRIKGVEMTDFLKRHRHILGLARHHRAARLRPASSTAFLILSFMNATELLAVPIL